MTKDEALQILDTIPTIGEQVDALEMAIKALEQQPCPYSTKDGYCQYDDIAETIPTEQEPCDAISRKDIQDYIAKYLSQYLYEDVRQAVEAIDTYIGDMPSVTQKSDVLDKISKDIKKAIDDCDSVYYTSALHKALEIINKYR